MIDIDAVIKKVCFTYLPTGFCSPFIYLFEACSNGERCDCCRMFAHSSGKSEFNGEDEPRYSRRRDNERQRLHEVNRRQSPLLRAIFRQSDHVYYPIVINLSS